MDEKLRQRMLAMMEPPAPLDATRDFLQTYVSDADLLTLERVIRHMMTVNPRTIMDGLMGIETLLRTPLPTGTLASLVASDANRDLDDPSDTGAAEWLTNLAAKVRLWMGADAPPPD